MRWDEPGGAEALRSPSGDAEALRAAAGRLRRVGAAASGTDVVRGAAGPALEEIWGGRAARAAIAEAATLATRARTLVEQLPAAATALERYATALEEAAATTRQLRSGWDDACHDHQRAITTVTSRWALDPASQAHLVDRLETEHRCVLGALRARHEACFAELARAGARCAATLQQLGARALPGARGVGAADVTHAVVSGLPMARAAGRMAELRARARAAAAEWRRLPPDADGAEITRWVARHAALARDPLLAQAFVEEVGIDGVLTTITEIATPGRPALLDSVQLLVGALGTIVLTAAAPTEPTRSDPFTRRRLARSAAAVRVDLVRSVAEVFASSDGRTASAGYWLVGQLLVGARREGLEGPLPPALLQSLSAAVAAAEIADTRDADIRRRHGTTLQPRGGESFASWFEDADRTGDALHQLLAAAPDVATTRSMLATLVPQPSITNARGEGFILAEHLVRRWVVHLQNGPSDALDTQLATDTDLVEAMRTPVTRADLAGHALRSRVMIELARTFEWARDVHATVRGYERHNGELERATIPWFHEMRQSIDLTLAAPAATDHGYSREVAGTTQPSLRLDELTGLVGAYALGAELVPTGGAPTVSYDLVIATELDHLRTAVLAGRPVEQDILRIAYLNRVASSSLLRLAAARDEADRRMWQSVAEAKNILVDARKDPLGVAESLVTAGTTRGPGDDLVISLIRSRDAQHQAEANARREDELSRVLDAMIRPETSCPIGPAAALLVPGSALAPAVSTSEELRRERSDEIADHLTALVEELLPGAASDGDTDSRARHH